jgi:hypothetical protein
MLRGALGLVSLLIVAVGAVLYFQETSPVAQKEVIHNAEVQADKAADLMKKSYDKAQAQVDAATGDTPTTPPPATTNAAPAGN